MVIDIEVLLGIKYFVFICQEVIAPDVIAKGNYVLSLVGHCWKCFFREWQNRKIYVTFYYKENTDGHL